MTKYDPHFILFSDVSDKAYILRVAVVITNKLGSPWSYWEQVQKGGFHEDRPLCSIECIYCSIRLPYHFFLSVISDKKLFCSYIFNDYSSEPICYSNCFCLQGWQEASTRTQCWRLIETFGAMHALFGTLLTRFIAKMGVAIVVVEINEEDVNFPEISFSFSDAWPRRPWRMVRLIFPNAMRRKKRAALGSPQQKVD